MKPLLSLNQKKYHRSTKLMIEHIESKGLLLMECAADKRRKRNRIPSCTEDESIIELYEKADVLLDRANSLNHQYHGMTPILQNQLLKNGLLLCAERTNRFDRLTRLQYVLGVLSRNDLEINQMHVHTETSFGQKTT